MWPWPEPSPSNIFTLHFGAQRGAFNPFLCFALLLSDFVFRWSTSFCLFQNSILSLQCTFAKWNKQVGVIVSLFCFVYSYFIVKYLTCHCLFGEILSIYIFPRKFVRMSRKMQINRLSQDELVYELTYRGIGTGTVQDMRHNLVMAVQLERSGNSLRYPKYPFSFEQDAVAVRNKIEEITPLVNEFGNNKTSSEYLKLHTKCLHVLGRIDNMVSDVDENIALRSTLLADTLSLMEILNSKAEEEEKRQSRVPLELSMMFNEGDFVQGVDTVPRSSVQIEPADAPGEQMHGHSIRSTIKPIPPSKWDLKFSGDKRGLSLNAFLERVEELRVARHISELELLDSGIDLFLGKAYTFYRSVRGMANSWDELVTLFKEEYYPADYNERLYEEIKRRTQGPEESFGIYLAIMEGFFRRLTCPITEHMKLKILMRNIAPYYQQQLALMEVTSISQLRTLCKKLEEKRQVLESFAGPSRRSNMLEPDLAYVQASESFETFSLDTAEAGRVCFRCNKPGHVARGCTARTEKYCFRCKRKGFTVRTCPDCGESGNDVRHP